MPNAQVTPLIVTVEPVADRFAVATTLEGRIGVAFDADKKNTRIQPGDRVYGLLEQVPLQDGRYVKAVTGVRAKLPNGTLGPSLLRGES